MGKQMRKDSGITLMALTLTIVIILILSTTIIYNVDLAIDSEAVEKMQSDISNLKGKITNYYAEYGTIPVDKTKGLYTIIDPVTGKIRGVDISYITTISSKTDIGNFYIIDLSALENLSLNNGFDYEKWKNDEYEKLTELQDIYIINETTHNIFHVSGIKQSGETVHTDYFDYEKDSVYVDLMYIDGYKINEKYGFISGNSTDNIYVYNKANPTEIYIGKLVDGEFQYSLK